jgi:hypothetical protein
MLRRGSRGDRGLGGVAVELLLDHTPLPPGEYHGPQVGTRDRWGLACQLCGLNEGQA